MGTFKIPDKPQLQSMWDVKIVVHNVPFDKMMELRANYKLFDICKIYSISIQLEMELVFLLK